MNRVKYDLFPGGLSRCLTMSYDDGNAADEQLIDIFNRYGIKGTFNVNSNTVFQRHSDVAKLYAGHELAVHMVNHPHCDRIPDMYVLQSIIEDKRALEQAVGYVIRGMAYPFGRWLPQTVQIARNCGMDYARTGGHGDKFSPLPEDFMLWRPTCHHRRDIHEKLSSFLEEDNFNHAKLFYIVGHSYEFPRDNNWDMMEDFCKKAADHRDKIWFATNIQIVDYVNAMRSLRVSADLDLFYNPSALDVWFTVNEEKCCCKAGQSLSLR